MAMSHHTMSMSHSSGSGSGSAGMSGMSGMGDMGGMQMTFEASSEVTILFSWWKTSSIFGLLVSCLIIALFGIFIEWLLHFKHEKAQSLASTRYTMVGGGDSDGATPLMNSANVADEELANGAARQVLTFLSALHFACSYLQMLVAMTFNVWLFISIVVGHAAGYYIWHSPQFASSDTACHSS